MKISLKIDLLLKPATTWFHLVLLWFMTLENVSISSFQYPSC